MNRKQYPYKYTILLKSGLNFSLLNPDKKTTESIIDDLVDKGVGYQETSGNITWYPPTEIEQVYFDFDE